jgi:hypothetical protein
MKTKIELDLKSVLVGAAATAVLIFSTGATTPVTNIGRFQVSVGGDRAAIVDTVNGQAWTTQIPTGQVIGTNTFLTTKTTP